MRIIFFTILVIFSLGDCSAESLHVITVGGTTPEKISWKITSRDLTPAVSETELLIGAPISHTFKVGVVLMENTAGGKFIGMALNWDKQGNSVSLYHYEGLGETPDKEKLVVNSTKKITDRLSAGVCFTATKVGGKPSTWLAGPLLTFKASKGLSLSVHPTWGSDGKNRNFLMVSTNL